MGKSIRSKREKRLRSLRRKIAEPFYDAKDEKKQSILDAIVNAPSQYTLHVASQAREKAMAKLERATLTDEAKQSGGEPGGEAAQEGPEAGDAMCVEEGAGGDKAAGANVRRSSRLGVKGSQRRGAQFKKKVKISKKMKNKLQRNAEYPV